MNPFCRVSFLCTTVCVAILAAPATAQPISPALQGPADTSRIKPQDRIATPPQDRAGEVSMPVISGEVAAPEGAKNIRFMLKDVEVEGVTAFSNEELAPLYAPYLKQTVTLDVAWKIADRITNHYRNAGYILSYAYVPEQQVTQGIIRIRVVEGTIHNVELNDPLAEHTVVRRMIAQLQANKPITSAHIESFLLRMNDLPGVSFRAILTPEKETGDQKNVKLVLIPAEKKHRGTVSFDNYGSRFLGPNELTAAYSASLLPLSQTTVSGLTSLPMDELAFITLDHSAVVAPNLMVGASMGTTHGEPGFTLKPLEVESESKNLSFNLRYQWLRQRDENLSLRLAVDGRNSATDILGTRLSYDRVRALHAAASYDVVDHWQGSNAVNVTFSQGIAWLGASKKNALNLTRAEATPDFSKMEVNLSRLQAISPEWSLFATAAGQIASGPLYSSEEFGYGGQSLGRAYDASEITGDHGISGSLEVRYSGWNPSEVMTLQPYSFYDIGTVWNDDTAQPTRQSGSSAGVGMRFATKWQQFGNLGLAWPLTRDAMNPIYGANPSGPRILLQVSQEF